MTKHDNLPYINHILDEILKIEKSITGLTEESFISNIDLIDATVRRIEIIGEAVKNISNNLKEEYDNVEWKKIAGMRDIIIHRYFRVDLEIVWKTIKEDLPNLKQKILKIKKDLEKNVAKKSNN